MKIIRTIIIGGGAFFAGAYTMAKFFKNNLSEETRLDVVEEIQYHVAERRALRSEQIEAAKSRHPAGKGNDLPFSDPFTQIFKGN